MTDKTLLIFLFSDRVDSYINAIAHSFDKMQIQAVKLVFVKGAKTGLTDSQANSITNGVWNRIQELANIREVGNIYKRIEDRLVDRHQKPLMYENLKNDLNKLINQLGGATNCIIDLTGATKAASIDIFSVCLALNVKSVYVFELEKKLDPLNSDKSLYDKLDQKDYSYTCLTATEPVQASQAVLLRKSPLLWSIGIAALVVMAISFILLIANGPNSLAIQLINIAAAIVGLASPLVALLQQKRN